MQLSEWIRHGIKEAILTFSKTQIILFLAVRCMQAGLWVGEKHNHGKKIWLSSIQQDLLNSFQICFMTIDHSQYIWFMEELILVKQQPSTSSHRTITGLLLRNKEGLVLIITLLDPFLWTIKMSFFLKFQSLFKHFHSLLESWLPQVLF